MVKRSITQAERFGVWKAWKGRCFWCRELILFREAHIDHLIPLQAVPDEDLKATVRKHYNLSPNFNFDGFDNWVPAHASCNLQKSFTLPDPSPAYQIHLSQVAARKQEAAATAKNIEDDNKKSSVLVKVGAALENGDITREDIENLFAGLPVPIQKPETIGFLTQDSLLIAPGWEVVEARGSLVTVRSHSGRFGMTSKSNDPSWICSQCGNKGPWNGIICLSCGNREEPD